MKVCGIVVEYNPLHKGHIYHIQQAKSITNCDYVVAVMSGNFVQRGEPAVINKWSRTESALLSGVDLVIELPFIYSISSAEGFSFGAISILNSLGIIDSICFGSECGDIELLNYAAKILVNEPDEFKLILHNLLKQGLSYPSAIQKALTNYIINNNLDNVNMNAKESINFTPNNTLGIEYIKSLIKLNSSITPYTINRTANNYNDLNITGNTASAAAIRNNINNLYMIKDAMPEFSYHILSREINEGRGPIVLNDFSDLILYKIRESSIDYLSNILDVSEGIEYKIKRAGDKASDVNQLISDVKNKRYTLTRIQRILLYILFDIQKNTIKEIKSEPKYIRVLGFNNNGKFLLRKIKEKCDLKIITNPSKNDIELLHYDILSTDIYSLAYKNKQFKTGKQDLIIPPVYINKWTCRTKSYYFYQFGIFYET